MARVSDVEMKWDQRPMDLVDWEAEERLGWWTRMWRAKWNLVPRGPKWLPEIIRMTWFLQVCGIVMGIHGGIDGEVGGPFFYSRTSCCGASGTPRTLPKHYDVDWPKTMIDYGVNVSHLKACDVPILKPDNSAWSHSIYCPNWDYVRAFTQKLNAGRQMSLTFTSLFFMPIVSPPPLFLHRKKQNVAQPHVSVLHMRTDCHRAPAWPTSVGASQSFFLATSSALRASLAISYPRSRGLCTMTRMPCCSTSPRYYLAWPPAAVRRTWR